jgi:ABC-type multidrug transport system fused ATPase/permease subunit
MGPHLRPHRRPLIIAGFALLGVALTEVLRPWPLKIVFDGLLIPQDRPDAIVGWLTSTFGEGDLLLAAMAGAILLIALIGGALAFVQAFLIASVGQRVVAEIRLDLYRHVHSLSHSFHDTASTGDILSRLTGDVRMMRDLLIDAVVFFAARSLVVLITVTVMLLMDWRLTLAALSILPPLYLLTRHFGRRIKGAAKRQRRKEGQIAVVMTEGISSIDVVKGFAREAYEEQRFARQNRSSARAGVAATRLAAHMERLTQVLLAAGTAIVLFYGVSRVRGGAISPGDLLVFTAYLATLYKPVRRIAAMTARISKASASGERLMEVFDLKPDVADKPDAIELDKAQGHLRFENVSFAYDARQPVLRHASLTIAPGETLALVGPSGMGKSSVARLIMRFYDPQEGRVTLDGADLRDIALVSLRDQVSVVLQDSVLFATSIRDNIAYGRLDADDEEILAAARAAGADAFIRAMPEGYDTIVGERGETLSGGQRQRIALARAILRDAPVLILDEPLNGLDKQTALDLLDRLETITAGRTTLLIAHDPLSLRLADRLVQIRDGQFHEAVPATAQEVPA